MNRQTTKVTPSETDAGSSRARESKVQRRWAIRPLGYSSLAYPNVRFELIDDASDQDAHPVRRSWVRLRDRLRRRLNALL